MRKFFKQNKEGLAVVAVSAVVAAILVCGVILVVEVAK